MTPPSELTPAEIEKAFRSLLDEALRHHFAEVQSSTDLNVLHTALGEGYDTYGDPTKCPMCPAINKAEYALAQNTVSIKLAEIAAQKESQPPLGV